MGLAKSKRQPQEHLECFCFTFKLYVHSSPEHHGKSWRGPWREVAALFALPNATDSAFQHAAVRFGTWKPHATAGTSESNIGCSWMCFARAWLFHDPFLAPLGSRFRLISASTNLRPRMQGDDDPRRRRRLGINPLAFPCAPTAIVHTLAGPLVTIRSLAVTQTLHRCVIRKCYAYCKSRLPWEVAWCTSLPGIGLGCRFLQKRRISKQRSLTLLARRVRVVAMIAADRADRLKWPDRP
ncbi:hypothetical protein VTK26DRAFT_4868 [Humicola hyalothermophila]